MGRVGVKEECGEMVHTLSTNKLVQPKMKSVSIGQDPLSPLMSRAQAYLDLTKPKIVFLLDFTALMAFLVATRGINLLSLATVLVAGTLASAGAGALNCYLDRDIDQTMGRTSQRPIPRGEVLPLNALIFGLLLVTVDRKSTRLNSSHLVISHA